MNQTCLTQWIPGIAITISFMLSGCGGGSLELPGDSGTVSGKLTFEGEPAPEGARVMMFHTQQGITGAGEVDSEGNFTLKMRGESDILVGQYQVAVTPPPNPNAKELPADAGADATVEVAEPESWNKIPNKYRDYSTSGKKFNVKTGENSFTMDMQGVESEAKK